MKSIPRLIAVIAMMAACLLLTLGSGAAVAASATDHPRDNQTSGNQSSKSDRGSKSSNATSNGNRSHETKKADAQPKPSAAATSSNKARKTSPTPQAASSDHSKGNASTTGDYNKPQPVSKADQNTGGANGKCPGGPYCSTRDGSASMNGNGNGKATGKPCAGCVGKADNKNPKGQYPNGSDHNAGYECDTNHGIGRGNPAHTGCTTPPPVVIPPICIDNPLTTANECGTETPPVCVDNPATETNECGTETPPVCVDNPATETDECATVSPPVDNPPVDNPPAGLPPVETAGGPASSAVQAPSSAKVTAGSGVLPSTGSPADLALALLAGLALLGTGVLMVRRTRA